jgi:MFS transporter, DHA1 family, inner membrane transport protein
MPHPASTSDAPAAQVPPSRMPWALLAAACLGMFAASSSGTTRAPFLIDMARDLETSVPVVANLVAVTSIAWGASSLFAGTASDRWGRRPFLIGGPVALALCLACVAASRSLLGVAAWATLAGACAGAFTGVLMAEAAARVPDRQRGRALGWVMAGQSLALLLGVPLAAWIGASVGWRGVHLCVAGAALAAAIGLAATARRRSVDGPPRLSSAARPGWRAALSGRVVRLLAMGVAERVCYGLAVVYFATFLQATYGLSLAAIAVPLAVFAVGAILGTILGGQLADRLPDRRRTFAGAMFGSGLVALALFGWTPGLAGSVALGFGYVLVNAVARPSLMASLAEVPEEVRGAVLGLNVTSASLGWLGAAALGGWMMAVWGFAGFGPLAAAIAMLGGALALVGGRRR